MKNKKTLINIRELQLFLSFVDYNRKFINKYFKKIVTLTKLTAKNI